MKDKRFLVWDLPTRVCHWLLALTVAAAIVTGQLGGSLIDWHGRIGVAIAALVVFRLVWGIVGSTYARFAQFFPTPASVRAYLAGQWQGEGHNPLGALSVLALLVLLAAQVLTGLFANDDIAFTGPLYALVAAEVSSRLTGLHHLFADGLMVFVALHVVAIIFYVRVRRQNLVKPMLTGWKENAEGQSARGGGLAALAVALLIAVAAAYGASGIWLPAPPPVTAAPDW